VQFLPQQRPRLPELALRRPWTVLVAVTAVCLACFAALQRMARDVFPPLGVPALYVAQPFGGMDPSQMEGFLTYYYEYHFLYIAGIERVESRNIQGAAILKLQFHPGTDMSSALSETIAYVNRSRSFMPPGTPGAFVMRFDAGSVPVGNLVFASTDASRTVGQLQDAALNKVRPLFATLPGVSAPPPFGGSARSIVVNLKPERLEALGLSPDAVVESLASSNSLSPSGTLPLGDVLAMVPTNAVVKNIQDLGSLVLRQQNGASLLLRDVAEIADASDQVYSHALVNGRRTVYMPVTKRSDASTLSVVELVKANLSKFQDACPPDIRVTFAFDQSPWILRAIADLRQEALLGALCSALMVLLFLRSFRSALVVMLMVPVSLAAASVGLWLGGHSLNLMTLGGLSLAVGILVDEATVEIENIHRRRRLTGQTAHAVLAACEETFAPRLLSMLCILAVFLPSLWMQGAARALFLPMALAVGLSMVSSFLLSSTLVPILMLWWGGASHPQDMAPEKTGWLMRLWGLACRGLLALRWIVAPAALILCVMGMRMLLPALPREIFPEVDAGQLQLRLRAAAGTRLERTEAHALAVLEILKREADVEMSMGLVGVHAPNYPVNLIHQWNSGPHEAVLQVQLRGGRGVDGALRERLRAIFKREIPGVEVAFEPADLVNRVMSFGSNAPLEVAVSGKDFALVRAHALALREALSKLPILRDVTLAQVLDQPTLEVQVDRTKAGLMGLRVSDATRALVAATASSRFTSPNYWADPATGISYSLQVQIAQGQIQGAERLRNLPVSGPKGEVASLRQIATLKEGSAIGQYDRVNGARVLSVAANLHGAALSQAVALVETELSTLKAPAGVTVSLRGQVPVLLEISAGLQQGVLWSVVVILLLLVGWFQSPRLALLALSSLPFALCGSALLLRLCGQTLNLQSAMGTVMAVGVSMANAVLWVSMAWRLQRDDPSCGLRRQAALACAQNRVRPILMTSLAMLAGMTPMALAMSQGRPLALATMGGLILGTVATLLILPSFYAWFAPQRWSSPSLLPATESSTHHP
jgi:multidrug efflux pump subunit AcrB